MAAYVGLAPVGEPHDRYYVVKSIAWAGTVKYVEQLGGRGVLILITDMT